MNIILGWLIKSRIETWYDIKKADTKQLQEECFKIRYKVYCEEKNFEDVNNFPNKMETDEYDEQSAHFLLYDKNLQKYIGTIRIIIPKENKPCPVIKQHKKHIKQNICSKVDIAWEISRIAVLKEHRSINKGVAGLILYLTSAAFIMKQRKSTLCTFIMETKLKRKLASSGFPAIQVSDEFEHSGKRSIYIISKSLFQNNLKKVVKPLYYFILRKV